MTTHNQVDPITAAIAAAQKVSQAVAMTGTAAPAVYTPPAATVVPVGRVRTMEDAIASSGTAVDAWLSVEANGLRFGAKTFEAILGKIALQEIAFPYMLRATIGGATKFFRSYDGAREAASNRPWLEVIAQAQSMDAACRGQYDAAEIPLILDADLVAGDKIVKAGSRVGITTPVTGFKPFMAWLKQQQVTYGSQGVVPVSASAEPRTKAGVRPWGVPVFTTLS